MNQKLVKGIIGIVLATACTVALTACSGGDNKDGYLEGVTASSIEGNWVASNYKFGINQYQYKVDMPPYVETANGYITTMNCNSFGDEYNVYAISMTPQVYNNTFSVENEELDAHIKTLDDALETSDVTIKSYLANVLNDGKEVTVKYDNKTIIENFGDDVYSCTCKVTTSSGDIVLKAYWIHITDRYGYMFLSENGEMLDKIISTISVEDSYE